MSSVRYEDYGQAVKFLYYTFKYIVTIPYHALALGHVFLKEVQLLVIRQICVMQLSNFGHMNLLFRKSRIGCRGGAILSGTQCNREKT